MGTNRSYDFPDGFQGLITAFKPQQVPISAFQKLTNCLVYNARLRKRPPFYLNPVFPSGVSKYACCGVDFIPSETSYYIAFYDKSTAGKLRFYKPSTNQILYDQNIDYDNGFIHWVKVGYFLFTNASLTSQPFGMKFYENLSGELKQYPIGLPKAGMPTILTPGAGGGSWSGIITVEYKITWVIDNTLEFVEGNGSDAHRFTVAGTNYTYQITRPGVPSGYTNITHWRIYRRNVTTNSEFQLIAQCTIDAVTYTEYGDLMVPSLEDICPELDHAQPPEIPVVMCDHKDRLWFGSDTGKLYYSKVNSPNGSNQNFYSLGYFQVGRSSEKFVKLISLQNYLLVIKQNSMWIVEGTDLSTFSLQQISKVGSLAPGMTFEHNGYLYYANNSGIWRTTLYDEPVCISQSISPTFNAYKEALQWPIIARNWSYAIDTVHNMIIFSMRKDNDSNACVLYFDTNTLSFSGEIETNSISLFNLEDSDTNCFCLIAKGSYSDYKLFYSSSEFNITKEVSFDVWAVTGLALPNETQLQSRLFRFIHLYSYSLVGDPEQLSLDVSLFNDNSMPSISFTTGSMVLPYKLGFQSELISLGFFLLGSNAGRQWEIGAAKLEYESVGHY